MPSENSANGMQHETSGGFWKCGECGGFTALEIGECYGCGAEKPTDPRIATREQAQEALKGEFDG